MSFADVKSKVIGFFRNEWPLKLISLLLAVFIWFMICEYVDPDTDVQVSNIKITMQYEDSVPEKEGLGVMTTIEDTVSIRVSGSRDTIALMDHNKITATLDTTNVTKSGEYDLPVKINLGNQNLKLVSQSLNTVKVRFDTNKVVNVKVNANVNGKVEEGFILEAPTMLNNFVSVTGPAAIVDTIASAEINIDQESFPETSTLKCEYTFVDEKGTVVPKTFLTMDPETVDVTVSVVKEKTVPMTVSIVNSSGGKDSAFCTAVVDPETITITGNAEVVDSINAIDLGIIDVAEKTENFETTVKVVLPNGVKNVNNIESVKVAVTFNDVQTRTFAVSNVLLENVPAGTKAAISEKSAQITLRGIAEDIGKLKAEDLKLTVDLANKPLSTGATRMAAYVTFPEEYKVGAVGKYHLTVIVS